MIKDFEHFVDRQSMSMEGTGDEVFTDMLTNATGGHWKNIRSIMTPTFTSGKMKSMFHLVAKKSKALIEYCKEQMAENEVVNSDEAFKRYTIDVIGECAFGLETNCLKGENEEFINAGKDVFKFRFKQFVNIMVAIIIPPLARLLKLNLMNPNMHYFKHIILRTIGVRKDSDKRGDFLDLILDARKAQQDDEQSGKAIEYSKWMFHYTYITIIKETNLIQSS